MKRLSLLDLGFFITENKDSPKHVAGLLIFKKPPGASKKLVRELYEQYRSFDEPVEPFNQIIDFFALGGPRWRTAPDFDIDQHVFYHSPEKVLSRHELYDGIARLHTPELDRSRPLWEFHIIDRVEGGRFAIYSKIHHAYADGVTLVKWTAQTLSESADDQALKPAWAVVGRRRRRPRTRRQAPGYMLRDLVTSSLDRYRTTKGLAKLVAQLALEQVGLTRNAVSLPFRSGGHTELTGKAVPDRQFAKASVPMKHVQRIRDMCRATLNHVALTCVDGALHRYLEEQGDDPKRPISIQMPVSLRGAGDNKEGNRIGLVTVDLANRTDDPYERLREIGFTLRNVRNQVDNVPPDSVVMYSILTGLGAQVTEMLGLADVLPPISDTLVSNVPGPKNFLYLKGSKLEEMCPVSTLMPGNRLNITLFSYAGTLTFGLIGTRQLGDLNRLAEYIEQAFVDLDKAVFNPRTRTRTRSKSRSKRAPKRKSGAG